MQHFAPSCTTTNCISGDEAHWPISGFGEIGNGEYHWTHMLCLRAGSSELHCNMEIRIGEIVAYNYEFFTSVAGGVCAGGARIWELHWETEDPHDPSEDDEMEIVHHVN